MSPVCAISLRLSLAIITVYRWILFMQNASESGSRIESSYKENVQMSCRIRITLSRKKSLEVLRTLANS